MKTKKQTLQICLTNSCNCNCRYCFAPTHYCKDSDLSLAQWEQLLTKIARIAPCCGIDKINIVGGEPLLAPYLFNFLDLCYAYRLPCTITTNGFNLDEQIISRLSGKINYLGLSVDSIDCATNQKIGRMVGNRTLRLADIICISNLLKKHNIPLKVNRVLSKFNASEDPSPLLDSITFFRLKLLDVYINAGVNDESAAYKLSEQEFFAACKKYSHYTPVIETNESMDNAYYLINNDASIVISKNGTYQTMGNMLHLSENALICLFL